MLDKFAKKAFEASEIRKNYLKIKEVDGKGKGKQNISMTTSQVQKQHNVSQRRSTYVPHVRVPLNRLTQQGHQGSSSQ